MVVGLAMFQVRKDEILNEWYVQMEEKVNRIRAHFHEFRRYRIFTENNEDKNQSAP